MNQGGVFHEIPLQSEMFGDLQRSWLICPLSELIAASLDMQNQQMKRNQTL